MTRPLHQIAVMLRGIEHPPLTHEDLDAAAHALEAYARHPDTIAASVRQHVLDAMTFDGYLDVDPQGEAARVHALHEIFTGEYGWAVPRYGKTRAIREWLMGLPSSCGVEFRSHEIIQLGHRWGAIPATGEQDDAWLESWFARCASAVAALFRQYGEGAQS